MKYADIIIDNRSDQTDCTYTYGCRDDGLKAGDKVYVPFARSRSLREGYVMALRDEVDEELKPRLRYVEKIDDEVSLTPEMVRTAQWMKGRYVCRYIDAIKCFTPVGEKLKRGGRRSLIQEAAEPGHRVDVLNDEQQAAVRRIGTAVTGGRHDRFLLHGVTGSGKTEVYIETVRRVTDLGRTAIILVPEISLTGQIIERFKGRFGSDRIAVLHSRLSRGERHDQWKRIRDGEVDIVIGARSAVFAPLENIGLIVVDEEHETTYKSDQTPKYDTVEVALKRTADRDNEGILLLGSATPSVVSYRRAEEGIYTLLELRERYNRVKLPSTKIVDMREELKAGNRSAISRELYDTMKNTLEGGKQVILFLNRRGYSTFISCRECGYVAKCPECGLSLTYHKGDDRAVCHYCGHGTKAPSVCPECGSRYIRYFGTGTEKIEEEIGEMFPGFPAERIDLDSVKRKGELTKKLNAFRKGKTKILIGTQLIAKGLDFRNVGAAGIISADVTLNIPDYRSAERTFQLITQAAGRAGRGDEEGRVVIQTYSPEHYAVRLAAAQDYRGFYEAETKMREFMSYPPYSDLFQIVFTSERADEALAGAEEWYRLIRDALPAEERDNIFRPQEAYLSKVREIYRFSILLKCPKGRRREYSRIVSYMKERDKSKNKKEYVAVVDINPYSFI